MDLQLTTVRRLCSVFSILLAFVALVGFVQSGGPISTVAASTRESERSLAVQHTSSGLAYPGEVLDQQQPVETYGFWFEDDVVRWQEFIPTLPYVTSIEVFVAKRGEPGNVIIELRTTGEKLLAQQMITEADAPGYDWARVEFNIPVPVTPGSKFRIYVYSDTDSTSPENRYFWRGDQKSSYDSSCETDVIRSWPDYDYAFKTYGVDLEIVYLPMVVSN